MALFAVAATAAAAAMFAYYLLLCIWAKLTKELCQPLFRQRANVPLPWCVSVRSCRHCGTTCLLVASTRASEHIIKWRLHQSWSVTMRVPTHSMKISSLRRKQLFRKQANFSFSVFVLLKIVYPSKSFLQRFLWFLMHVDKCLYAEHTNRMENPLFSQMYCWIRSVRSSHLIEIARTKRDWLSRRVVTGKRRKIRTMANGGVFDEHIRPCTIRPGARRTRKRCSMQIYAYGAHTHKRTHSYLRPWRGRKSTRFLFGSCLCDHIIGQQAQNIFWLFFVYFWGHRQVVVRLPLPASTEMCVFRCLPSCRRFVVVPSSSAPLLGRRETVQWISENVKCLYCVDYCFATCDVNV